MLAIIQARMSSSRLPGKMMMNLAGRPLIGWVCERVSQATGVSKLLIATSTASSDNSIAEYCYSNNISIYRGSLDDVAGRFLAAVENEGANAFIRINGDSPLIDPEIIDRAIDIFNCGLYDLVTNVQQRTFPRGQSVEVILTNAFKKLCKQESLLTYREHVTKLFYVNHNKFRIKNFISNYNVDDIQLSVDTMEDFELIEKIICLSNAKPGGWREVVDLVKTF